MQCSEVCALASSLDAFGYRAPSRKHVNLNSTISSAELPYIPLFQWLFLYFSKRVLSFATFLSLLITFSFSRMYFPFLFYVLQGQLRSHLYLEVLLEKLSPGYSLLPFGHYLLSGNAIGVDYPHPVKICSFFQCRGCIFYSNTQVQWSVLCTGGTSEDFPLVFLPNVEWI